jgi:hypothetical protein
MLKRSAAKLPLGNPLLSALSIENLIGLKFSFLIFCKLIINNLLKKNNVWYDDSKFISKSGVRVLIIGFSRPTLGRTSYVFKLE